MTGKCANSACSATRFHDTQGKLFRVDVDLGNKAGDHQWKTMYVWLCTCCAQQMHPKVEVAGDRVQVRLGRIEPILFPEKSPLPARVN